MRFVTRQDIDTSNDRPIEHHLTPEWGGEVCTRSPEAGITAAYEEAQAEAPDGHIPHNLRATIVGLVLCDESGALLYAPDEIEILAKRSPAVISRLFPIAMRLCGWDDQDIQEMEKNSGSGPDDDSPSDSVSN